MHQLCLLMSKTYDESFPRPWLALLLLIDQHLLCKHCIVLMLSRMCHEGRDMLLNVLAWNNLSKGLAVLFCLFRLVFFDGYISRKSIVISSPSSWVVPWRRLKGKKFFGHWKHCFSWDSSRSWVINTTWSIAVSPDLWSWQAVEDCGKCRAQHLALNKSLQQDYLERYKIAQSLIGWLEFF